jgi:hypothetical protein
MDALLIASGLILILMRVFGPADTLDARFFYDQMEAWSFFQTLSEEDSRRYLVNELFDLVFIGLYSAIFYRSIERHSGWRKSFLSVAWIPGIFDLIETSWILIVLQFGEISGPLLLLGWMTMAKWISVTAVLGVLSLLFIRKVRLAKKIGRQLSRKV